MSAASAMAELTCERFAAGVVTDYMEGDLDSAERGLVEIHLAGCEGCVAVLDRMSAVAELLRELDHALPATEPDPVLIERFRSWASERAPR